MYLFSFMMILTQIVLSNIGEPDEALIYSTSGQGLHCLPLFLFRDFKPILVKVIFL